MQKYPGKYFLKRDPSCAHYFDDTVPRKDLRVLAPCEATAAPEVSEDEQYQPIVIARPYKYKRRLFKARAADLTGPMRKTFFVLGATCHLGGVHSVSSMPGTYGFNLQTLQALERRQLIILHRQAPSWQRRVEMTEFGKELWRAVFHQFAKWYHGNALYHALRSAFAFEHWGERPKPKRRTETSRKSSFSLSEFEF